MPSDERLCKHCGGEIRICNPTGKCDHLYWPDNLTNEAKRANGILLREPDAFRPDRTQAPPAGRFELPAMADEEPHERNTKIEFKSP